MALKIPCDGLEVGAILGGMFGIEAMIHVIMDQRALGIHHGLFHGVKLLGDFKAGFSCLDHLDYGPKMPFGAFQPGNKGGMGCMQVRF